MPVAIPKISEGVFTIPEVARILDLPTREVGHRLREYWEKRFSKHTGKQYATDHGGKLVNFYTLIEFYVFYQLRAFGVPTKNIQKAHRTIAQVLQTEYPFAHAHLLTDGKSVLFENDTADIIEANDSLQLNLREIIHPFCRRIEFGADKLPVEFYPAGRGSAVVINPRHQFGVPVVKGTNIPTETIYQLFRASETVPAIARMYEISEQAIRDAIRYHNAN